MGRYQVGILNGSSLPLAIGDLAVRAGCSLILVVTSLLKITVLTGGGSYLAESFGGYSLSQ